MNKQIVRQMLTESALYLFEVKGFDGVTIDDIAIHAKRTRTCFYHYFKSKEDLFLHQSEIEKENYLKILRKIEKEYVHRPDIQMRFLMINKMRLLYKSSFFKIALENHLFERIPELQEIRNDFDQKILEQYSRILKKGVKLGIFISLEKSMIFFEFYQKMQKGIESKLFEELDEDLFFEKYMIAAELAVKALSANNISRESKVKELSKYPEILE